MLTLVFKTIFKKNLQFLMKCRRCQNHKRKWGIYLHFPLVERKQKQDTACKECKLTVWRKLWNELVDKAVFGGIFSSSIYSHAKIQITMTSKPAALPSHFVLISTFLFDKQGLGTEPVFMVAPLHFNHQHLPCPPSNPDKVRESMDSRAQLLL